MRTMILLILGLLSVGCSPGSGANPTTSQVQVGGSTASSLAGVVQVDDQPVVAIWRADGGNRPGAQGPFLRVAIWSNGSVVFAEDSENWDSALREGTIPPEQMASLKEALAKTGILDLEGYCYLVPDGPKDCVLVRLNDEEQILYWDEREDPSYGINVDPQERHLQFKAAWKSVNNIALASIPSAAASASAANAAAIIEESWYVKRAIQSL